MKTPHYSIIVILLSIGLITGLFLINYLEMPRLVSKQQAIDTAVNGFHCKKYYYILNNTSVSGKLLHIKNNSLFVVDEKNMQNVVVTRGYIFDPLKSSEYVWEVVLECYDPHDDMYNGENSLRFVDAKSGVLLQ